MRLNIALRNLVISQIIILFFLVFAYFVWFPHSFLELGGFTRTALMLIFADLILGPLLVFIVFKEGKKYLKFDINVLLSIQIIAFLFGAYSLYLKHPAYAVFKHDRFILTNVSHLYPQPGLQEQLTKTVFSKPHLVMTSLPENMSERMNLMMNVDLFGAPDIEKRPKYYAPVADNLNALLQKSLRIEDIFVDKDANNKLQAFIKKHGGKINDYAYFPLSGNNKKQVIWVLNRQNAEPVGIIDSNPWTIKAKQQKRIHTAALR
jgi:hypothetical protein